MRVLLAAGVDLSLPGGVETHVLELARGLTARGHEVEIEGRPASLPPFRMVGSIDPRRYDVVHHHGGPWPRGLRLREGARYVRTFHFSVLAKMRTYVGMGRLRTLLRPGNYRALAEERASLRRGGALIAVSNSLRRDLVRLHGADPGRIQVIPNGARFDPPAAGRVAWRQRHGIEAAAPMLLTIGRDDYVKGLDLLERAWRVASAAAGARSAGAREMPLWVRIGGRQARREAGRWDTGPLAPSDVTEWIHAADVGAVPSYYEGGGIALLDMLAGGLYTLTHDVGVASEVIRAGQNGEILPRDPGAWAQALRRVLASPPRRSASLGADYRWESIAGQVEELYREFPLS